MHQSFDETPESGTEVGRSPTGVPDSGSRNPPAPHGEPPAQVSGGAAVGRSGDRFESQAGPELGAAEPFFEPEKIGTAPQGTYPRSVSPRSRRRTYRKPEWEREDRTPQERLLLLDTWRRSGLPAGDFASLVGVSKHTLYAWK